MTPICDKSGGGAVSISADASFNHRTGEGSWGAVLENLIGDWREVGGVLENCPTSAEAEVRAIANGLESALTRNMLADGGMVMVQSSCTGALSILLGVVPGAQFSKVASDIDILPAKRLHANMRASEGLAQIKQLVAAHRLELLLRHTRRRAKTRNTARKEIA